MNGVRPRTHSQTRFRQRLTNRSFILVGAAALTLAACTSDQVLPPETTTVPTTTTTVPRADDGILSIGVLLPATGPGAALGTKMKAAIDDAVATINEAGGVLGHDIELVVEDEALGRGFSELLNAGVDAVVGPASSSVALSQLSVAVGSGTGVVTCSPSATALALDNFPDNGMFYRTAPSDSMQMAAIARQVSGRGFTSITIAHLDDPYGRGLADSLTDEVADRGVLRIIDQVSFSGDQEDLTAAATEALQDDPPVVVVLADADDGGRFLTALNSVADPDDPPEIIINDAIRTARQAIQDLSDPLRANLTGVAPAARWNTNGPEGAFAGHASDCVNLIALAAVLSDSDAPSVFGPNVPSVSVGGFSCTTFAECADRIRQGRVIDYNGASGRVDLSAATGDPVRAWFDVFSFNSDGTETEAVQIEIQRFASS